MLLERPSDLVENAPDLRFAIGPLRTLACPHLPAKTVVLRNFPQKPRKFLPAFVGEAFVRAGIDGAAERFLALLLRTAHPPAYGPVGHAERLGNVSLLPSFVLEFEGSQASFFLSSLST